jgi:hypothetical protein
MLLAKLLAGACALLLGRQLFWLFVGVVGFAVGMEVAGRLFAGTSAVVAVAIAVLAGLAGAVLAIAAQEFMIGVVGFVAGSYLAAALLMFWMPHPGRYVWFALFGGGLAGAVLLSGLFDWALIVLSSLVGAGLMLQPIDIGPQMRPLVYCALVVAGILVQAGLKRRRPPPPRR